jgi:hypothetical protein
VWLESVGLNGLLEAKSRCGDQSRTLTLSMWYWGIIVCGQKAAKEQWIPLLEILRLEDQVGYPTVRFRILSPLLQLVVEPVRRASGGAVAFDSGTKVFELFRGSKMPNVIQMML